MLKTILFGIVNLLTHRVPLELSGHQWLEAMATLQRAATSRPETPLRTESLALGIGRMRSSLRRICLEVPSVGSSVNWARHARLTNANLNALLEALTNLGEDTHHVLESLARLEAQFGKRLTMEGFSARATAQMLVATCAATARKLERS